MIKKTQIEMVGTEKSNVFEAKGFNLWYGNDHALKNIEFDIAENECYCDYWTFGLWKVHFCEVT